MPLYNYARFLREAIESVLEQTYERVELVIVDDGSTDASFEIAKEYEAHDARVRVHTHPGHVNRGVSPTLEAAYREARGEFLCSLSADDLFASASLEMRLAPLQADCSAGFSYCRYDWIDEHGRILDMVRGESLETLQMRSQAPGLLEAAMLVPSAPGINLLVRRSLYELLGGFREGILMSDWDLLLRAIAVTKGVFVDGPPLVTVRYHAGMSSVAQPRDDLTLALFRALDDNRAGAAGRLREARVRALVRLQRAHLAHRVREFSESKAAVESVLEVDPSLVREPAYFHWWLGTREWLRTDDTGADGLPEWIKLLADPAMPVASVMRAGASRGHFGCLMVETFAPEMDRDAAEELRWRVLSLELVRYDRLDAVLLRGFALRALHSLDLLGRPSFVKALLCTAGLWSTVGRVRRKGRSLIRASA